MPTAQIPLHLAWLFPSWGSWRSAQVNCQLCRVVDSCHVNVLWSQVRWLSVEQLILTLLSLSGWRDSQRQSLGGEWWSHGAMKQPWGVSWSWEETLVHARMGRAVPEESVTGWVNLDTSPARSPQLLPRYAPGLLTFMLCLPRLKSQQAVGRPRSGDQAFIPSALQLRQNGWCMNPFNGLVRPRDSLSESFLNSFMYLFIGYAGSPLLRGPFSLVVESGGRSLVAVPGPLLVPASLVERGIWSHGLQQLWLPGPRAQAQ